MVKFKMASKKLPGDGGKGSGKGSGKGPDTGVITPPVKDPKDGKNSGCC